ncbi:putative transferase CAF17, mitochondrial [Amphibalanus amphitrite]|uniref:Putative transferase CAF17, mitochondrial n=1 Tax=Amphibalanus amphitrite TaxID=1232801 RepID=A0A6A4WCE2_AMPAM|nr:putative transferase CAF17, mitochondrial [Amphibalanus amphitrite]
MLARSCWRHLGGRPVSSAVRSVRQLSAGPTHWMYPLTGRGLVRVRGPQAVPFLQGLVTNDMRHFEDGARAMYAMMLNNKGRVLFDLLIHQHDDDGSFFLEVDRSMTSKLQSMLKIYRVRRAIEIDDVTEQTAVFVVQEAAGADDGGLSAVQCTEHGASPHATGPLGLPLQSAQGLISASRDPRLAALGWRLLLDAFTLPRDVLPTARTGPDPRPLRYRLGVAEGADEVPYAACTPLEYNADYLHGVSFHKGCYVGQELTARTHHTGVIRKRVMPLHFSRPPGDAAVGAAVRGAGAGRPLGRVLAVSGPDGIGLMRVAECLAAPELTLEGDGCVVTTHRPDWWPQEAAKDPQNRTG